jgi:hypothetical protein
MKPKSERKKACWAENSIAKKKKLWRDWQRVQI